ncbi:hypothetical protein AR540_18140 [Pseudomonas sp. EpS/L25]|nr:hypothetical protein AR540_18140 [Pseudomonas sp. EpS/L25]
MPTRAIIRRQQLVDDALQAKDLILQFERAAHTQNDLVVHGAIGLLGRFSDPRAQSLGKADDELFILYCRFACGLPAL